MVGQPVMQQMVKRTEHHWIHAATAALDILRADTPRAADVQTILEWGSEAAICRTWAEFIDRSFTIHDDPLVACCQAGRTIVTDYYSRPPLAPESVSDLIKNSLGDIIGGAIFATLHGDQIVRPAPKPARRS